MSNFPILHNGEANKVTTHAQHFTSPQQFTDQALALFTRTAPDEMNDRNPDQCEYWQDAQSFNGYLSGDQFRDNVHKRVCNENTRAAIHATSDTFTGLQSHHAPIEQVDLYHDETGMFLDSNAYYNGDEFNMVSMEFQQQTKPIIYIAGGILAPARWDNTHFLNRGMALIKCVHALERQGVSVGVIAYAVSNVTDTATARKNSKPQHVISTIIVKQPDQPLDESDLINTFTTCTIGRTAGFQNMYYQLGSSTQTLGQVQTLTREDLKHARLGDTEIAVIPHNDDHDKKYSSLNGAVDLLKDIINTSTSVNI